MPGPLVLLLFLAGMSIFWAYRWSRRATAPRVLLWAIGHRWRKRSAGVACRDDAAGLAEGALVRLRGRVRDRPGDASAVASQCWMLNDLGAVIDSESAARD